MTTTTYEGTCGNCKVHITNIPEDQVETSFTGKKRILCPNRCGSVEVFPEEKDNAKPPVYARWINAVRNGYA